MDLLLPVLAHQSSVNLKKPTQFEEEGVVNEEGDEDNSDGEDVGNVTEILILLYTGFFWGRIMTKTGNIMGIMTKNLPYNGYNG